MAEVTAWVESGAIRALPVGDGATWISGAEALRAGHAIRSGTVGLALPAVTGVDTALFAMKSSAARALRGPLAVSSSMHAALVAAAVLATTLGLGQASAVSPSTHVPSEKMRLVYVPLPGPGGGGGGGGLKQKAPPPKAQRKGNRSINSPLPVREAPKKPEPVERPPDPEPPKVEPEPLPPVEAPIVMAPSDEQDVAGVLEEVPLPPQASRGPGEGGGVGTGSGTGIGEGEGTGVGDGSGGGEGGGPYRPGSGIEPPSLLREVKPDYTEEARRRGVEGDVVMEIVVRRDGTVGEVRVLQGLGHGLDQRATAAVRQWRFSPARRRGSPVDVVVEVAMEFKIR